MNIIKIRQTSDKKCDLNECNQVDKWKKDESLSWNQRVWYARPWHTTTMSAIK